MRTRFLAKMLAASIAVCFQTAFAQWERIPSPVIYVPLSTQAVAVQGDTILLGTYQNTIFRSTDGGASWTKADSGLSPSLYLTFSFLIGGNTVYAGTYDGIYVSTDMGESWTLRNNGVQIAWGGGVYCFLKYGESVFAGTSSGVYFTTDNGNNWSPDTTGLGLVNGAININSLASNHGVLFAGTNDGIYRSTDGGVHWQVANAGIPIWWGNSHAGVEGILVDSAAIHIVTNGWGIFRSTDDGNTWSAETTGLDLQSNGHFYPMTSIIRKDSLIIVGTQDDGVCISSDRGNTWRTDNTGLTANSYVLSLSFEGNTLFAADYDGLYRKTAGGQSWSSVLTSFVGNVDLGSLGGSGRNLVVNAYSNYLRGVATGIYLTTDGGNTWLSDTSLKTSYTSFQAIGTNLYATGPHLYVSSDQGFTWVQIDSGLSMYVNAVASNGSDLFAAVGADSWQWGESGGIYVSSNGGASWALAGLKDTCLVSVAANNNTLFAGGLRGVYRSADDGVTWTASDNGLPPGQITAQLISAGGVIFAATVDGVFRSGDDGESWEPVNAGLPLDSAGHIDTLFVLTADDGLIAGTGSGIYVTSNSASKWVPADSGLSGDALQIRSLAVMEGDLYAATGGGIRRRPLSELLSVDSGPSHQPESFRLFQNYPNPFNPSTVIGYVVPRSGSVMLDVYDVLGRKVATLVNGRQSAGYHSVTFNARGLPSGVYFYRLQSDGNSITKKLALVK